MKPFVLKVGDSHVAFYPTAILENGWEPYDQPHQGAYMPFAYSQCERHDIDGVGAIVVHYGSSAKERTMTKKPP